MCPFIYVVACTKRIAVQTMTTMTTFVLAMTLYPEVARKAQAEIDHVVGLSRLPGLDDKDSLPYLECIIKELYRY